MSPFEQREILESMVILCDSRECPTERARKRYEAFGVPYQTKAVLDYGDYTYNAKVNGEWIHDTGGDGKARIFPLCAVERKKDLDELVQCFTRDRKRFEREMQRATDHGARLYLIVENASWEKLINGAYRSRMNPNSLLASIVAWWGRYNLHLIMCKEETTSRMIREVLFRDLKERIERGEFDGRKKDVELFDHGQAEKTGP